MLKRYRLLLKAALFSFLPLLFLCGMASGLSAQGGAYRGWQYDETLKARNADIFTQLKGGTIDADRQGLEKFFENFYFAQWTLPENAGQVQRFSEILLETDFKDVSGSARDYLLNRTFDTLRKMAADSTVTPTARYNALYTIGKLNLQDRPSRTLPPVPYAPTLQYLVNECRKEENPQYLKVAALLGILRHIHLGSGDADMRGTELPTLLYGIIENGKPARGRDANDQALLDWFRIRALEGLGGLKSVGNNVRLTDILLAIVDNSEETIEVRCTAARTFGELDYNAATPGGGINYQRIANSLILLARAVGENEAQTITTLRDRERATRGGTSRVGSAAGPDTDPSYESQPLEKRLEIDASVQRLKANFTDIITGMRGRLQGTPNGGIALMLPEDDPVVNQMNQVNLAVRVLFKTLDSGPEETTGPTTPQENMLKVNLAIIREELQKFGLSMGKIIGGV